MTNTISYYNIVDAATLDHDVPFQLTSQEFTDVNECYSWLWSHEEDLRHAVEDDIINGVAVKETKVPARFLVVGATERGRREVPSYLWFGARILGETDHYFIVGIPSYYADSQAGRLHSGMHYCSAPLASLEDAQREASVLESQLYGPIMAY